MAVLVNNLEPIVTVAFSTLSVGEAFLLSPDYHLKIVPSGGASYQSLNLTTFTVATQAANTMVTPVAAAIDEV